METCREHTHARDGQNYIFTAWWLTTIPGIAIVIVYDVVVSLIILKVIDAIIGLRVTKDVEQEGLDLALHGEAVQ